MGRSKSAKRQVQKDRSVIPRQIAIRPVVPMTMRYLVATALSDIDVTSVMLRNMILAVSTETTSAQATPIFRGVRVRSVDIWATTKPADAGSAITSLRFMWLGYAGFFEPKELSVFGTYDHPAHIHAVPPKNSLAAMWIDVSAGTADVFSFVTVPAGAVIDINFEYILADASDPATEAMTEVTITSAVASGLYAPYTGSTSVTPYGWTAVEVASVPFEAVEPPTAKAVVRANGGAPARPNPRAR